jgi:hypothetical protein
MADDIKTVEDKLASLISPLVDAANFICNSTAGKQVAAETRQARKPSDFPRIYLERGRSRRQPFTNTTTFGTFGNTTCPRIETRSQEFVITTVTDKRGDVEAGQLDADIQSAIVNAGAQLGLPAIVRIVEEIASSNELTSRGKAMGTERRVFTTTVRVGMRKAV